MYKKLSWLWSRDGANTQHHMCDIGYSGPGFIIRVIAGTVLAITKLSLNRLRDIYM